VRQSQYCTPIGGQLWTPIDTELDDQELVDIFVEDAFEVGETIRSVTFRRGSAVSLVQFADHFFGSDDVGVYGPFRTIEEAIEEGPQFWGRDDIIDDRINPRFRDAFTR
jgi:hypothetical protein